MGFEPILYNQLHPCWHVFENKDFQTYLIKRIEVEDQNAPSLIIATMHRVKGLEFAQLIKV
jgi:hypothetical protein